MYFSSGFDSQSVSAWVWGRGKSIKGGYLQTWGGMGGQNVPKIYGHPLKMAQKIYLVSSFFLSVSLDTRRKLNVYKTFRRRTLKIYVFFSRGVVFVKKN